MSYSETSLIRHSMGPENNVGLGGYWIMEYLLPYLCMVTVPRIMVGLERMLDYRGFAVHIYEYHVCPEFCLLAGISHLWTPTATCTPITRASLLGLKTLYCRYHI